MPSPQISDPTTLNALLDAVLLIESDLDLPVVLRRIIEAATQLTGATYGALGVLDPAGEHLEEFVTVGIDDEAATAIGPRPTGKGVLGLLIHEPRTIRLDDITAHPASAGFPPGHPPMRSFLGVPIHVRGGMYGNLYLTEKHGAGSFSESDERVVEALAVAAAIAVENAQLHARIAELTIAEERERIARDLHDTVIQRLFATGLSLQAVAKLSDNSELGSHIAGAVDQLDETIRQIRTSIFALAPTPPARTGLRSQILEVTRDAAKDLGFEPEVRFAGTIDPLADSLVARESLALLRALLADQTLQENSTRVEIEVACNGETLRFRVTGDGIGLVPRDPEDPRGQFDALEVRARGAGGTFSAGLVPTGGIGGGRVEWCIPIAPPPEKNLRRG